MWGEAGSTRQEGHPPQSQHLLNYPIDISTLLEAAAHFFARQTVMLLNVFILERAFPLKAKTVLSCGSFVFRA